MYKLIFFVPASHLDVVKEAVFATGAGHLRNYDRCAWLVRGEGQFRPLPGSDPFVGTTDTTEFVDEYRVEMICSDSVIRDAVMALVAAHPYEEPAYETYPVYTSAAEIPTE